MTISLKNNGTPHEKNGRKGGISISFTILGITDPVSIAVLAIAISLVVIFVLILIRKYLMGNNAVPEEPQEEIFRLVSRIKYPQGIPRPAGQGKNSILTSPDDGSSKEPAEVEIVAGRADMRASMRAIVEKYSLSELTLATEDGLVFATSADRDIQADAVKYSQIFRHQAPPDEPDVSLFDLLHRESRLIGIVRTPYELPQNWKRQIRDDTKVILQWWL